jgi:hypothetical protein
MTTRILQASHPLSSLPFDTDLSVVFETEDMWHMSLQRLETLIKRTAPGETRAYLYGLYDMRRSVVYAGGS